MFTPAEHYNKKFNAQRAAKARHLDLHALRFFKTEHGWTWEPVAAEPEFDDAARYVDNTPADVGDECPNATTVFDPPAEPRPAVVPAPRKPRATWIREGEERAAAGLLPPAPDFSAATHAAYRGKLAKLVAMAEAGDIAGLRTIEIKPYSSSPKAMAKYRDLCVRALETALRKFEAAPDQNAA